MAKVQGLKALLRMGEDIIEKLGGAPATGGPAAGGGVTPNSFNTTMRQIEGASDWGGVTEAARRAANSAYGMSTEQVGLALPALRSAISRVKSSGAKAGEKWKASEQAAMERLRMFEERVEALAGGAGGKKPPTKTTAAAADEPPDIDGFINLAKENVNNIKNYGEAEGLANMMVTLRGSQPQLYKRLEDEGIVESIQDATVTTLIRAMNNRKSVSEIETLIAGMGAPLRTFLKEAKAGENAILSALSRNKVRLLKKAYKDAEKLPAGEDTKQVALIEQYILRQKDIGGLSDTQIEALRLSGSKTRVALKAKRNNLPPEGGAPAQSGRRTPPNRGGGGADPLARPLDEGLGAPYNDPVPY